MFAVMEKNVLGSKNIIQYIPKKYQTLVCIFFLFVATFSLYGKLLFKTSVGGDFFAPVSYALNFQKAFDNGQFFPRWIITPRGATPEKDTPSTNDKTPVTGDGTGFMYYCYLSSAIAYPFLKIGMHGQQAVGAVVFLSFFTAVLLLYACGRILEASKATSVIAASSYLFSPWLFCNVYSRGGVAEAVSEGILPLLFLGFAFLIKKKNCWAIFCIASGTFMLALAHNIFLLWGITVCLIFAAATFFSFLIIPQGNLSIALRNISVIGMGILLGMLLSSWQWLPAILTLKNTSMEILALTSHSTPNVARFADYWGIIGWPRLYVYKNEVLNYFYTIGWWTIPSCVIGFFYSDDKQKKYIISLLITFLMIFLFAYYPSQTFKFLPTQFIATQGTYRLLGILSCLGAFALCFVNRHVRFKWAIVVLVLIFVSQLRVFTFSYGGGSLPDSYSIHSFEINDYHPNSPFILTSLRDNYSGKLRLDNIFMISDWLQIITQAENRNKILDYSDGKINRNVYLRIKGHLNENKPTVLTISSAGKNNNELATVKPSIFDTKNISTQDFDVTFSINHPTDNIQIRSSEELTPDQLFYSFTPNEVYLVEDNPHAYINATELIKIKAHGYERVFKIKPNFGSRIPNHYGFYTVEIPMIYNKFIKVFQENKELISWCDFNHRINVKTNDLSNPIIIKFTWPMSTIVMSIFGLIVWTITLIFALNPNLIFRRKF